MRFKSGRAKVGRVREREFKGMSAESLDCASRFDENWALDAVHGVY